MPHFLAFISTYFVTFSSAFKNSPNRRQISCGGSFLSIARRTATSFDTPCCLELGLAEPGPAAISPEQHDSRQKQAGADRARDKPKAEAAPAGQEIAVFVNGARLWLTLGPAAAGAIGELSFRSYLDGLRDSGWAGAEADVRLAYAASAALWAGIPAPLWLRWFTLPERREWLERKFGMPLENAVEPFSAFIAFALDLADEALAL